MNNIQIFSYYICFPIIILVNILQGNYLLFSYLIFCYLSQLIIIRYDDKLKNSNMKLIMIIYWSIICIWGALIIYLMIYLEKHIWSFYKILKLLHTH